MAFLEPRTPEEWRVVAICRLIARYAPERADKIRAAGGPMTELVQLAIKNAAAELNEGERLTKRQVEMHLQMCLEDYLWKVPTS